MQALLAAWRHLNGQSPHFFYAFLGENDLAIEWLTKAVDEHYHGATWANVEIPYGPLRDDPRFQDLLLRMNLAS